MSSRFGQKYGQQQKGRHFCEIDLRRDWPKFRLGFPVFRRGFLINFALPFCTLFLFLSCICGRDWVGAAHEFSIPRDMSKSGDKEYFTSPRKKRRRNIKNEESNRDHLRLWTSKSCLEERLCEISFFANVTDDPVFETLIVSIDNFQCFEFKETIQK